MTTIEPEVAAWLLNVFPRTKPVGPAQRLTFDQPMTPLTIINYWFEEKWEQKYLLDLGSQEQVELLLIDRARWDCRPMQSFAVDVLSLFESFAENKLRLWVEALRKAPA
ncbi:hypothetical protein [Bradyrhizobium sp. DASA03120]|uniref:hypothetical protein n=1 Tax=Bradyrhizobium sp. SMVTL-02 TaxID=3395917 RepID=UPI003F711AD1